jgi:hypothetical protein
LFLEDFKPSEIAALILDGSIDAKGPHRVRDRPTTRRRRPPDALVSPRRGSRWRPRRGKCSIRPRTAICERRATRALFSTASAMRSDVGPCRFSDRGSGLILCLGAACPLCQAQKYPQFSI